MIYYSVPLKEVHCFYLYKHLDVIDHKPEKLNGVAILVITMGIVISVISIINLVQNFVWLFLRFK